LALAELVESFTAALGNRLRSDPPKRKGDRTRERFKLATAQVLENVGFHAMRLSDITDAADASEGTFYIYFRDKRDATRTVLQEFLGGMQDKVNTDLAGAGSAFQARGLQLLPFAMLTDVIHAARGDQRDCAGAFTGLWTAIEKSGLALGPLVIALILQEGGFRSGF